MTATGKRALELLRLEFDTSEISRILNLPENVVCDAIYFARQEEKQRKEDKKECKQPQAQS